MTQKMVHLRSDSAAQFKTLRGWFSRHGVFHGNDEQAAREHGCTHADCQKCGAVKRRCLPCEECAKAEKLIAFNSMPEATWNGEVPAMHLFWPRGFANVESFNTWCQKHNLNPKEQPLILCEPIYLESVDDDFWEDQMSSSQSFSVVATDEIKQAIEHLNSVIKRSKIIAAWREGSYRVKL